MLPSPFSEKFSWVKLYISIYERAACCAEPNSVRNVLSLFGRLIWIIARPSLSSGADMGCDPSAQRFGGIGMRSDRVISAIGIAANVSCALSQYPFSFR
jgi:hypothetical protein